MPCHHGHGFDASASNKGFAVGRFHMVRLNNEQIGSIFWLAVGVAIAFGAASHGLGTPSSPEAGFMPFLAGVGMCLFASIGLVRATIQNKEGAGWRPILKEAAWPNSFIVLGALLFYAFLLPRLGFILCTVLFLGFLFRCIKPMSWWWVAVGSILCTLGSWGLFELLLKVPLPKGLWGI